MKIFILLTFTVFLCGCSTTYWNDRREDLTDFAHLRFQYISVGVTANVMHVAAGLWMQNGGGKNRTKLGLGGIQQTEANGGINGLGFPLAEEDARSGWGYAKTKPAYGSIGVDVGAYIGIGARVDIVEFFDFLLGFAGVDFIKDDENSTTAEEKKERDRKQGLNKHVR